MGLLAIHDDHAFHALFNGIDAGLDLGDHAARHRAIRDQAATIIHGERVDHLAILVEDTRHISHQQQALGTKRPGNGPGKGIGIDIIGLARA